MLFRKQAQSGRREVHRRKQILFIYITIDQSLGIRTLQPWHL
jgi:hypothetical protein